MSRSGLSTLGRGVARRYASSTVQKPYNFYRLYEENHLQLQRVPIPDLKQTIQRYLHSMKGILNETEYAAHEKLVRDFENTVGPEVQKKLVETDQADARLGKFPYYYFEKCWDEGYLAQRESIFVNTNPFFGFNKPAHKKLGGQTKMAALFLSAYLKWVHKLKSGQMDAEPGSDISQFYAQVGTARLPRPIQDVLTYAPDSRHVVVIHENKIFKLEVITADGKHASPAALEKAMENIISDFKSAPQTEICALSGEDRDWWASQRRQVEESSPVNAASLKDIDSALFVICLDSAEPKTHDEWVNVGLLATANRWYDKSEIIVCKNGLMGILFEHSHSDGMTWIRWIGECWNHMHGTKSGFSPLPNVPTVDAVPTPQLLKWELNEAALQSIEKAKKSVQASMSNVDLTSLEYTALSRDTLSKKWKVSPDGAAQVAYNLAHSIVHGYQPAVYESCSTRNFFHGRTETIRAATPEAKDFIYTFLDKSKSASEKWAKFVAATAAHGERAREASKAQGVDRHMLGLSNMASVAGIKHPLFSDPLFKRGKTWRLSTSNITTPYISYFAFGAVIPDGYGIGYCLLNDSLQISVSSFKDNPTTDTKKFVNAIATSFEEIGKLAANH
eukprot:RCo016397